MLNRTWPLVILLAALIATLPAAGWPVDLVRRSLVHHDLVKRELNCGFIEVVVKWEVQRGTRCSQTSARLGIRDS